jgi:hypothetical protein
LEISAVGGPSTVEVRGRFGTRRSRGAASNVESWHRERACGREARDEASGDAAIADASDYDRGGRSTRVCSPARAPERDSRVVGAAANGHSLTLSVVLATAHSPDARGGVGIGARPSFTVRTVIADSLHSFSSGAPTSIDVNGSWSCGAGAIDVAPRTSQSGAAAYAGAATSHATSAVAIATKKRAARDSIGAKS